MTRALFSLTGKSAPIPEGTRVHAISRLARRSHRPADVPMQLSRKFGQRGVYLASLLLGAGFSSACTVTALSERQSPIAVNECEPSDACGGGQCRGGMCVAQASELSSFLFEVNPASNAGSIAGASFLTARSRFAVSGEVIQIDLESVRVKGSLTPTAQRDCVPQFSAGEGSAALPVAANGTIPVRATFTPSGRASGVALPGPVIGVETSPLPPDPTNPLVPRSHQFDLEVPSGVYDVHLEPVAFVGDAATASSCKYAPQLIRSLCIDAKEGQGAELKLVLPVPAHLNLVVVAQEQRLTGWIADVIDPKSGRRISQPVALALPSTDGDSSTYAVGLDYLPIIEHEACEQLTSNGESELVRLSPPTGEIAPVLLFKRTALELFSPGNALIDQLPVLPEPVVVEGHVFSGQADAPEGATLTFVASRLSGVPAGVLASFTRQVETLSEGRFEAKLLPGTYGVHVSPNSTDFAGQAALAATGSSWEVASSPLRQAGRAIELRKAISLLGSALVPGASRDGARGASVVAEASSSALGGDVLARALSGVSLAPRATTTVISDTEGRFGIFTDPGIFDFSIRPPERSGFAWLVMPNLDLSNAEETRQLSGLELPLPVVIDLRAQLAGDADSKKRLEGARVRAYASIDASGEPTPAGAETSLVPVAEGRLDENGSARLLVPASLHQTRVQ